MAVDHDVDRPSWVRLCAWVAFLSVVPSAVWRVLMILGLIPGSASLRAFELEGNPALGYSYVIGLSVVQLLFGFLSLGLIRRWGERIGGWSIPRWLPLVLGVLGGLAVIWIFNISMVSAIAMGQRPDAGHMSGWPFVVLIWCYLPILLWGPAVIAAAIGYWRARGGAGRDLNETVHGAR